MEENNNGCPLFKICNCKTAVCRFLEPDESCFWYWYFEKLIKNKRVDD